MGKQMNRSLGGWVDMWMVRWRVRGEDVGWVGWWCEVVEEWGESGWQGDVTPYIGEDTPYYRYTPTMAYGGHDSQT